MKNLKAIILSGVAATAVFASGAAQADVFLSWDVDKAKSIDIDIFVVKFKFATIDVMFNRDLEGAAEAHAFGNQWNGFNRVSYFGDEGELGPEGDAATLSQSQNMMINKTSETLSSFNNNQGIMQANQDSGNMAQQGNFASIALTGATDNGSPNGEVDNATGEPILITGTFAHSEAYSDQVNVFNETFHHELTPFQGDPGASLDEVLAATPAQLITLAPGHLNATIDNSFRGNSGVLQFNQNTGNSNNQSNALAAAIGDDAAYALADAGIAQVNGFNVVDDENTVKYDTITGSFSGNSGIINVNQSTGYHNNQSTVVSVAAISSLAGIGLSTN